MIGALLFGFVFTVGVVAFAVGITLLCEPGPPIQKMAGAGTLFLLIWALVTAIAYGGAA